MLNYSKEVNEKIYTSLFYHYYMMCNKYGEDNIFGIFAIGSMNYGSYNPDTSDVDTKLVIIPSADEILALKPSPISTSNNIKNEKCNVQDIRAFFKGLMNQNPNSLEVLATPFYYINPKWAHIWDYIVPNIDEIAHIDEAHFVSSALGQIKQFLTNTALTPKQAYHCERLAIVCKRYLEGQSLKDCIQLDKPTQEWLNKIKFNKNPIDCLIDLDEEMKLFEDFIQKNKKPEPTTYSLFTEILRVVFLEILSRKQDYNVTIRKIHIDPLELARGINTRSL